MKKGLSGLAALAIVITALASCADFFTNSWAKDGARDPGTIKVTSSNVDDLLKEARGDRPMSRGILDKLEGTTDPVLQAAAVTAGNQAAGLGQTVLSNLDILLDDTSDTTTLTKLAKEIQDDVKRNDIVGIADILAKTLPVSSGNPPTLGDFSKEVSTSDLTLMAVTLVLAEAERASQDFDTYIAGWGGGGKDLQGNNLSPNERLIAAVANEAANRPDSQFGDMLKNLLNA
ncbi:MAG: hypothetical protein LBQ46_03940 [Treponema sp.]|jgi:hypothetical protein|nr:hypothetical protein [Treponema sp.]